MGVLCRRAFCRFAVDTTHFFSVKTTITFTINMQKVGGADLLTNRV